MEQFGLRELVSVAHAFDRHGSLQAWATVKGKANVLIASNRK